MFHGNPRILNGRIEHISNIKCFVVGYTHTGIFQSFFIVLESFYANSASTCDHFFFSSFIVHIKPPKRRKYSDFLNASHTTQFSCVCVCVWCACVILDIELEVCLNNSNTINYELIFVLFVYRYFLVGLISGTILSLLSNRLGPFAWINHEYRNKSIEKEEKFHHLWGTCFDASLSCVNYCNCRLIKC